MTFGDGSINSFGATAGNFASFSPSLGSFPFEALTFCDDVWEVWWLLCIMMLFWSCSRAVTPAGS